MVPTASLRGWGGKPRVGRKPPQFLSGQGTVCCSDITLTECPWRRWIFFFPYLFTEKSP